MKGIYFNALLAIIVWIAWFYLAGPNPFIYIQEYWEISVTMIFGSLIAGATSEGGGAVAFPVFTKLLHINPVDAKVFSFAIQSIGMTSASLVIIYLGIKVEWRVIFWASLGGALSTVLSSIWLAPLLPSPVLKMSFTAMITSFAITLFVLNRREERLCHDNLPRVGLSEQIILISAGFLGGILSGLVGTGIDVITFSFIVLLFRLSEKVGTPTSVIIMSINTLISFALHGLVLAKFTPQVQAYWFAAMPIVVIGAPVGAMICNRLNRIVIARILILLIAFELVTSLWLIPLTSLVVTTSLAIFILFSGLYYWMYRIQTYEPIRWIIPSPRKRVKSDVAM
jgi:uncharacterized membrane protein YfcA